MHIQIISLDRTIVGNAAKLAANIAIMYGKQVSPLILCSDNKHNYRHDYYVYNDKVALGPFYVLQKCNGFLLVTNDIIYYKWRYLKVADKKSIPYLKTSLDYEVSKIVQWVHENNITKLGVLGKIYDPDFAIRFKLINFLTKVFKAL